MSTSASQLGSIAAEGHGLTRPDRDARWLRLRPTAQTVHPWFHRRSRPYHGFDASWLSDGPLIPALVCALHESIARLRALSYLLRIVAVRRFTLRITTYADGAAALHAVGTPIGIRAIGRTPASVD